MEGFAQKSSETQIPPRKVDPNRIRLAREARSLTQIALAEKIGVSVQLVSKWEIGLVNPVSHNSNHISTLSGALNLPETFFNEQVISMPGLLHQSFRTKASMSTRDKKAVEAVAYIIADQFSSIIQRWIDIDWEVPFYSAAEYSPAQIASLVRHEFQVGRGPIENLVKVVESRGIPVVLCDFGESAVDGLTVRKVGLPPIIFLNSDRPGERVRFTLAHELGHLVMHILPGEDLEKEADEFASEFLMPTNDISESLFRANLARLYEHKVYWKTSVASLVMKAKQVGAISAEAARRMFIELSKQGGRKNELFPIPVESPRFLKGIIEKISNETGFSIDQIAYIVGASSSDFRFHFLGERRERLKLLKFSVDSGRVLGAKLKDGDRDPTPAADSVMARVS